jgi:DNA-directed RNA polymerase subunit RPC12/RpoP
MGGLQMKLITKISKIDLGYRTHWSKEYYCGKCGHIIQSCDEDILLGGYEKFNPKENHCIKCKTPFEEE